MRSVRKDFVHRRLERPPRTQPTRARPPHQRLTNRRHRARVGGAGVRGRCKPMGEEPLEPDKVRLTTGETVRFRLLVKPSARNPGEAEATIQSSRPLLWARLDGPVATRLADLESILLDL